VLWNSVRLIFRAVACINLVRNAAAGLSRPARRTMNQQVAAACRHRRPAGVLVTPDVTKSPVAPSKRRVGFFEDFRRFFMRGLAALLPTLITVWVLVKVWDFLWEALGQHAIWTLRLIYWKMVEWEIVTYRNPTYIARWLDEGDWNVRVLGVVLAIVAIYVVGFFVGNIIGRAAWRLMEMGVMRIPLLKQIYPAVKQVTDLFFAEKSSQFQGSRVVACQARAQGIWAVGLVTGTGLAPLSDSIGEDMVTVFIPSSPTAFAGYVVVVARKDCVELPMNVEQVMRLLMTGGVVSPPREFFEQAGKGLDGNTARGSADSLPAGTSS
jgi:uncharacterized membrane protein